MLTPQPFCVALGLLEVLILDNLGRIHILSALDTRVQVSTKTGQLHNSL